MSVQLAFLNVKSIIHITVRENDRVKGKDVNSNPNEVILYEELFILTNLCQPSISKKN